MHPNTTIRAGYILLTVMLLSVAALLRAGSTGSVVGRITDKDTGDPIPAVSVLVLGTKSGAVTDFDGRFKIEQIDTGIHKLRVSHLDYATLEVTEVVVTADSSVEVSLVMEKKVTSHDVTLRVTAAGDVIDKFEVSNQTVISRDVIAGQPVTSVEELLTLNGSAKSGMAPAPAHPASVPSERRGYPPAHGGTAIVNGEAFDAMFFENYGVNPFVDTEDDHFSTFAVDVDDAAFVMARSYLSRGHLPPKDAVRTEEFVNHFDYGYDAPGDRTFQAFFEGAPSRFGQNCQLLKIGIKGLEIRPENRKAANLVFVIDVSGSMGRENRLGLVKQALRLLVDQLNDEDRVGIVVYGSVGREVLDLTSLEGKDRIIAAIELLITGGSTNAEEGLRLGYAMAERHFEAGKINRIILCSDGVANVGRTGADDILKDIKRYADKGITLTTIGFGMGNYNDVLMEKLGDKGNGHYAYVDHLAEARRVFVENLTGTLQVIARDVKIQVDFNPETVRSYRLLGYENRDVADDKFRDDKEDGGEIGSGHEVTALYEVKFVKEAESDRVGTIFVRWKDPTLESVTERNWDITRDMFRDSPEAASRPFKLASASAEFAEILRESYWAKDGDLAEVLSLVQGLTGETDDPDVIELLGMISKARQYQAQLADR